MRQFLIILLTAVIFAGVGVFVGALNDSHRHAEQSSHEMNAAHQGAAKDTTTESEFERGPHRGRMLRDGEFALEITIFEDGAPPRFHVYPYLAGKPFDPSALSLQIELGRLGNEVNQITFSPVEDYLQGNQTVVEPHSFDVTVRAQRDKTTSEWKFQSYEGRTQISAKAAEGAGIKIDKVGPASIKDNIELTGVISLNEDRNARVGGRFAGFVKTVNKSVGQAVRVGDVLATIDRNLSLADYDVLAPIDGVVVSRAATVGIPTTTESTLFEIADLSTVWAELHAFGRDRARVKIGQTVVVESHDKSVRAEGIIEYVTPIAEQASQAVVVRVVLDNKNGEWVPGSFVRSVVTISERIVPLAVKAAALQRFRDFTVAFRRVGDMYEVRMLELGASDGTWTEVLGGIKAGDEYVSDNSFLIKADIEKSGASHDH